MAMNEIGSISGNSPAAGSAAAIGNPIRGLARYDAIQIVCNVEGISGETLDLYLQSSWDNGTTWLDWAHLPQLAAGASATIYSISVPQMGATGITEIGSGSSPALAAGSVLGGAWGPMMRVYAVPSGTATGVAQSFDFYGYLQRF